MTIAREANSDALILRQDTRCENLLRDTVLSLFTFLVKKLRGIWRMGLTNSRQLVLSPASVFSFSDRNERNESLSREGWKETVNYSESARPFGDQEDETRGSVYTGSTWKKKTYILFESFIFGNLDVVEYTARAICTKIWNINYI